MRSNRTRSIRAGRYLACRRRRAASQCDASRHLQRQPHRISVDRRHHSSGSSSSSSSSRWSDNQPLLGLQFRQVCISFSFTSGVLGLTWVICMYGTSAQRFVQNNGFAHRYTDRHLVFDERLYISLYNDSLWNSVGQLVINCTKNDIWNYWWNESKVIQ